jgi:hypothetical protein
VVIKTLFNKLYKMKKYTIYFILHCFLCFIVGNINAQTKTTYSLFTYKEPKGVSPDETDPSQKVYYKDYESNKYVIFYVWQKKKATATPASDYSAFIKELQEMYPTLKNQYDRKPQIKSEKGFDIVWQTATAKATDIHLKTEKEEPISIYIKLLRNKKKSAAIHIVTNDADRAKGDMAAFFNSLKTK